MTSAATGAKSSTQFLSYNTNHVISGIFFFSSARWRRIVITADSNRAASKPAVFHVALSTGPSLFNTQLSSNI